MIVDRELLGSTETETDEEPVKPGSFIAISREMGGWEREVGVADDVGR